MSTDAGRKVSAATIARAVTESRRDRSVDPALVRRVAVEELPRSRNAEDAVKRVKRRLHQAVGAYVPGGRAATEKDLERLATAHREDAAGEALRAVCRDLLARHASTRERLPFLDRFYAGIWDAIGGAPASLLDLGCGIAPLALPWIGIAPTTRYTAIDADAAAIALVDGFLTLAGQPHMAEVRDLAAQLEPARSEVALLLKLVPILDRQHPDAALRLLESLDVHSAVISFPVRSLGGRLRGMEATYRHRIDALVAALGPRVRGVREASIPNELVVILKLGTPEGSGGG